MCRFGDIGGYEKDNVFIGESIDNFTKFKKLRRRARLSGKFSRKHLDDLSNYLNGDLEP